MPPLQPPEQWAMTLHFLPGMGADQRLWQDYRHRFPQARFHHWPALPHTAMTLADYCAHCAQCWDMRPEDRIIGVSMGGMVAAELSRQLPSLGCVLISSCTQISELNPWLKSLSPLRHFLPWRMAAWVSPRILPGSVMRQAQAMYRDSDKTLIGWAMTAILRWPGVITTDTSRIQRIHGSRDAIFPLGGAAVDQLITGGSHLMVLTHQREVMAAINAALSALKAGGESNPRHPPY